VRQHLEDLADGGRLNVYTLGQALGAQNTAVPRQLNHGQDAIVGHFADSEHFLVFNLPERPSVTITEIWYHIGPI
jgi:hypothetical protein